MILAIEGMDAIRLRSLIEGGADPNGRDEFGMPHLHRAIDMERDAAAQNNSPLTSELTEVLLDMGADPRLEWKGRSALAFATSLQHVVAETMIRGWLDRAGPARDRARCWMRPKR